MTIFITDLVDFIYHMEGNQYEPVHRRFLWFVELIELFELLELNELGKRMNQFI